MGYDLHVVRTRDWLESANDPVTKQHVDSLIKSDPELRWSLSDFVDMRNESSGTTRYFMILWNDSPCFWWYRDQITCSNPDDYQRSKLAQIASALGAFAVGDDGERYELRKGFLGKHKLIVVAPDA